MENHLEFPELGGDVLAVTLHRDVVRQGLPFPQNQILAAGLNIELYQEPRTVSRYMGTCLQRTPT